MRSLFTLLSVFLLASILSGQSKKTANYIRQLDNNQFLINHEHKATFDTKSPAMFRLIKQGVAAAPQLLEALNDTSKTIMAHATLCHIYFKHVSFAGPKYVGDEFSETAKYYLGQEKGEGLIITEVQYSKNTYVKFVLPEDRQKITDYWKKKIKG